MRNKWKLRQAMARVEPQGLKAQSSFHTNGTTDPLSFRMLNVARDGSKNSDGFRSNKAARCYQQSDCVLQDGLPAAAGIGDPFQPPRESISPTGPHGTKQELLSICLQASTPRPP